MDSRFDRVEATLPLPIYKLDEIVNYWQPAGVIVRSVSREPGPPNTDEYYNWGVFLPEGWGLGETWEILDEKGRVRAMINHDTRYGPKFTIFWTRYQIVMTRPRFVVDRADVKRFNFQNPWKGLPVMFPTNKEERDSVTREDCKTWLDEHYPDWRDPQAYWDE